MTITKEGNELRIGGDFVAAVTGPYKSHGTIEIHGLKPMRFLSTLNALIAKDLSRIAGSKLEKLIAQIDHADVMDAALSALIEAGRGHERMSDTRERAKNGCPLSVRYVAIMDARSHVREEMNRRQRWHGSLAKIPALQFN